MSSEALRVGWREFRTEYPPSLLLTALLPRGALQIIFFTLLGQALVGSPGRPDAFVGALVLTLTGTNVSNVVSVPLSDKEYATFWRIRSGRLPASLAFLARSAPYPIAGLVLLLGQAAIAAPVVGLPGLAWHLLPWFWIFALVSFSFAAAGLAGACLTISRRADVLAPNVLTFLVMLCCGAILPHGRIAWVDALGSVLPGQHALTAVRAAIDGGPWLAQAGWETVVCAGWIAAAVLAVRLQARRARKHGQDDFD